MLNMTTTTPTWVDMITDTRTAKRKYGWYIRKSAHMGNCVPLRLPEPSSKSLCAENLEERALDKAAKEADSPHDHTMGVVLALASRTDRTRRSVVTLNMS